MPVLGTILLLFAAYGLGRFLIPKEGTPSPASLEGILVTTSVGLALFPLLLIFGWLLGLPVITWIPLVLGLILMGLTFRTWWVDGRPFHHDHWDAAALGLGVASLSVYLIGAYQDPWIGGLDGWEHAVTIRYILDTGSLDEPFAGMNILHYTDAYPPAFDLVGAAVTWLSGSVFHAVKLIGCFFPALCIPLLHFLVRRLTGDSAKWRVAWGYFFRPPNIGHGWHHGAGRVWTEPPFRKACFRGSDFRGGVERFVVGAHGGALPRRQGVGRCPVELQRGSRRPPLVGGQCRPKPLGYRRVRRVRNHTEIGTGAAIRQGPSRSPGAWGRSCLIGAAGNGTLPSTDGLLTGRMVARRLTGVDGFQCGRSPGATSSDQIR